MKQQNMNSKTETWAQTAVRRARYDNQDNAQTPAAGLVKEHGMIGQTDIDSYLEDRIEAVSPQDRNLFEQYARKYINNCGGLAEQISICLDIAFEETELTEDEEEPTEDEPS